jgi:hypothetical protein
MRLTLNELPNFFEIWVKTSFSRDFGFYKAQKFLSEGACFARN